jgi:drug/metabolite transporter superfamily protein YnfA
MHIALSLMYFLAAGLCEIGRGYLVWLWLREGKSPWVAALGAVVLVLYGMIPPTRTRAQARLGHLDADTRLVMVSFTYLRSQADCV